MIHVWIMIYIRSASSIFMHLYESHTSAHSIASMFRVCKIGLCSSTSDRTIVGKIKVLNEKERRRFH